MREVLQTISGRLAHNPLVISLAAAIAILEALLVEAALAGGSSGHAGQPELAVYPSVPATAAVVYGALLSTAAPPLADRLLALLGDRRAVRDSERPRCGQPTSGLSSTR